MKHWMILALRAAVLTSITAVFVAEVPMSEEAAVTLLTGVCMCLF